jgi:hypothetical protein
MVQGQPVQTRRYGVRPVTGQRWVRPLHVPGGSNCGPCIRLGSTVAAVTAAARPAAPRDATGTPPSQGICGSADRDAACFRSRWRAGECISLLTRKIIPGRRLERALTPSARVRLAAGAAAKSRSRGRSGRRRNLPRGPRPSTSYASSYSVACLLPAPAGTDLLRLRM